MNPKTLEKTYALLKEKRTKIMGILNATPDSFTNDGVFKTPKDAISKALQTAERFLKEGVDIIDIGGESTRPDATPVSVERERERVLPIIQALTQFSIPLSIDTTKSEIATQAIQAGATMINDVSGLLLDPEMVGVVAKYGVPVIATHSHLTKKIHQSDHKFSTYTGDDQNIVTCVMNDLDRLVLHMISHGINHHQIIIDPGIGFGKTPLENLQLIKNLHQIKTLSYPVLLGASRKSFIGYLTGASVEERLPASLAVVSLAVLYQTDIVRVHDVSQTKQVVELIQAI